METSGAIIACSSAGSRRNGGRSVSALVDMLVVVLASTCESQNTLTSIVE